MLHVPCKTSQTFTTTPSFALYLRNFFAKKGIVVPEIFLFAIDTLRSASVPVEFAEVSKQVLSLPMKLRIKLIGFRFSQIDAALHEDSVNTKNALKYFLLSTERLQMKISSLKILQATRYIKFPIIFSFYFYFNCFFKRITIYSLILLNYYFFF